MERVRKGSLVDIRQLKFLLLAIGRFFPEKKIKIKFDIFELKYLILFKIVN